MDGRGVQWFHPENAYKDEGNIGILAEKVGQRGSGQPGMAQGNERREVFGHVSGERNCTAGKRLHG